MRPPLEVLRLAAARAEARAAKDFTRADELRAAIVAAGWAVVDGPDGWRLEPRRPPGPAPERIRADQVRSVLHQDPVFDLTVLWLCEGWPEDVERGLAAFRKHVGRRSVQYVIVDVTGGDPSRWSAGGDVEVVPLAQDTGWGTAMNAGLSRSLGGVVIVADGSVEPTDDPFEPVERALRAPEVGVCGPFGLVTPDMRQFDEVVEAGPCDAIQGYLMAFRRSTIREVGPFDERFRWYRTADIDYSFRVKDAGYRAEVVPLQMTRHEHRSWFNTDPVDRGRWSKRNFYRFLDRWRGRWDLILSGPPADGGDEP